MREPTPAENPTPEQLAGQLRERARAAATAAVRAGLQEIDSRYGMHVADEVVRSLDIDEVFAGLMDKRPDPVDEEAGSMFEVRLTRRS